MIYPKLLKGNITKLEQLQKKDINDIKNEN